MNTFHIFFDTIKPLLPLITSIILFICCYPLIRYGAHVARRFCDTRLGAHVGLLFQNGIYYGGLLLLLITIFTNLGINVSALLGAAGVIGIAVGFAAQTTIANVISGIFLLLERPFSMGDEIECDSMKGTIESIDPLSIKLRTKNNQLVRIPNETLIKKSLINHSFYPIQRLDIKVRIRDSDPMAFYDEIMAHASSLEELLVKDPAPQLFVINITSISASMVLRCWVNSLEITKAKRKLIETLITVCKKHYPKISVE